MPWLSLKQPGEQNDDNPWSSLKPYSQWLNTGRSALSVALRSLRKIHGCNRIWIPTFVCPCIRETCLRNSFSIEYYSLDRNLNILPGALDGAGTGDAFLWVHYFGFFSTYPVERLLDRGVWIVEDAVQSALTGGVGKNGNFVFQSLRKFTPLPDGAYLGSDFPLEDKLESVDSEFIALRLKGKKLKAEQAPDREYLELFERSEALLDADYFPRSMSAVSKGMLKTQNLSQIIEKRRGNYLHLSQFLNSSGPIRPLFSSLPDSAAPLGLPVVLEQSQRNRVRSFLAGNGIYCAIHWLLAPGAPQLPGDEASWLSERILTLPIDQRYSRDDMEYIWKTLKRSGLD